MYSINSVMNKKMAESIADSISREMAKRMYRKFLLFRAMTEISDVESGRSEAKRDGEIDKFFSKILS